MKENETDLIIQRKGGGSIIETCPVFASDAVTLYVVWGPVIRAYSVKTGELVGEYEGLTGNAVGVHLHPTNPNTIVACSEKGKLLQWDSRSKLRGKSVTLRYDNTKGRVVTAFHLLPPVKQEHDMNRCRVCVIWKYKNSEMTQMAVCCNQTGSLLHKLRFQLNDHHSVALGGRLGQQYLAGIYQKCLQFCDTTDWGKCDKQYIGGDRKFTTVACHPEEKCIATGDNTGRILLWWNLLSSENPSYSIYHWHTLPCRTIAFSHAGTQFFSGGGEAVLVKWTIDSTTDKDFLPRLPSGICHIAMAPDNKYLAVCTIDNGIRIITPQMKLSSVVQHFTWCVEARDNVSLFPAGIVFYPRNKTLVMNGRVGHIQFYSPRTKSLIYNLDITGMNYHTQERHVQVVNTDVVRVSFNSNGQWMATVEQRDDGESDVEIRLKFWHFDDVKQIFCLNTSVELPHNGAVIAVAFQPVEDPLQQLAVTTGSDFKYRTWTVVESTSIYRKGSLVWRCESVGFYRNLPVGDVSFSMDGSLLAVAFGPTLTVWIPETNHLKCSLTPARSEAHIKQVKFGQADCCHLIVTCSAQKVSIWNLLTLKLMWTVPLHVSILTADPCSEFMAIFTTNNDLFVFSPNCSNPKYSHRKVVNSNKKIISAAFIPHSGSEKTHSVPWQENSQLYFLDSSQELLVLDRPGDTNEKEGLVMPTSSQQPVTPFGSLLAKQKITDVEKLRIDTQQQLGVPGATAIKELINVPAHTMPPVKLLCGPFLRSMVASNSKNIEEKKSTSSRERTEVEMETEDSGVDSGDETSGAEAMNKPEVPDTSKHKTLVATKPTDVPDLETCLVKIFKEKMDWVGLFMKKKSSVEIMD